MTFFKETQMDVEFRILNPKFAIDRGCPKTIQTYVWMVRQRHLSVFQGSRLVEWFISCQ